MTQTNPKTNTTIKIAPLAKLRPDSDWHDEADDIESAIDARLASLQSLLVTEDRIRRAKTENELQHLITNETRKFSGARQVFLLRRKSRANFVVSCVSSMAIADRDTPLIRWIEKTVECILAGNANTDTTDFELPGFADIDAPETKNYPFKYICWQPLKLADGTVFAGMILARNTPWNKSSIDTLAREAEFYAHAWSALKKPKNLKPKPVGSLIIKAAITIAALLVLFLQVPLTTLAPVEVVAKDSFIVSSPIDGVIDKILINPNQFVTKDQPLVEFNDTKFRNQLEIAERDMRVAEANYRRVSQAAFFKEEARHQLAITKAELELKRAEYNYASEEFDRTILKAPRSGLAIFASKDDWKGRPIATGVQIMHIADPSNITVSLNLPVADAIVIKQGAAVRLFLDANPLSAVSAQITETSYHAVPTDGDKMTYRLRANLTNSDIAQPRIGARGTAQIYGENVPLIFYLFRRPLSWLRQNLGI